MHIRPMQPADLPMLARHRFRHINENGRNGDLIFTPSEEHQPNTEAEDQREIGALAKSVTTPGWMRIWLLTDESEVFGEITLINRPPMKAALHRCFLMMGLERSVRAQGWGTKLMQTALDWAKREPSIEWINLYVFENNIPAQALYRKFGFESVGTTRDMFRVFGQSIDDMAMVLKLR